MLSCLALSLVTGLLAGNLSSTATATPVPYYTTDDLGPPLKRTNPLKGFLTSPNWRTPPYEFPSHLEYYYLPLNEIMTNNSTFDWTPLEERLDASASRECHAVLRFYLDYPTKDTGVPQHLIDGGLAFNEYYGGLSPDYGDEKLGEALEQFITAFGGRYDGDTRIGFVQVGLLGFWGEWHTYTDGSGDTESWIPSTLKNAVVHQFETAFSTTPLQTRVPWPAAVTSGFGLHDDSFAHSTLSGEANGGVVTEWFFWPKVERASYTDFWGSAVMGGELRPELQSTIFTDNYPHNTEFHQDFDLCVNVTHATYMLNGYLFIEDGTGPTEDEIQRAKTASAAMGYSFQVTQVQVAENPASKISVTVTVTVTQTGVAPFYYPLALTLDCTGITIPHQLPGVETIVVEGDSREFSFDDVPASAECLGRVNIGLSSAHVYPGRRVEFAQVGGDENGDGVFVTLPLPPTLAPSVASSAVPSSSTASPTVLTKSVCLKRNKVWYKGVKKVNNNDRKACYNDCPMIPKKDKRVCRKNCRSDWKNEMIITNHQNRANRKECKKLE